MGKVGRSLHFIMVVVMQCKAIHSTQHDEGFDGSQRL